MPGRKKCIMFCVMWILLSVLFTGCSSASGTEELLLNKQEEDNETDHEKDAGESAAGADSQKVQEAPADTSDPEYAAGAPCMVYVCGAVNVPGVYELPAGSRIFEALDAAGGVCAGADPVFLNRAEEIQDGQQIYVPTVEEAKALTQAGSAGTVSGGSGEISSADGKVNLNTASKEELMTLTGIGEAKADSILAYREEHGRFTSVEELMQIPGIKEGVFQKIRDSITVA